MLYRQNISVPQLLVSTTQASLTGTTSPTVLGSFTLPANTVGPNGMIRLWPYWGTTNSANVKTLSVKVGGSDIVSFNVTASTNILRPLCLFSKNVDNSQSSVALSSGAGYATSASAMTTIAIDFTTDQTIQILGTLANSGETITLNAYYCEIWNFISTSNVLSRPTPKLFSFNTASSVTGTITPTTLATYTLPGKLMGPNAVLRITSLWTNTNSANIKTLSINFGAQVVQNVAPTTTAAMCKVTHVWTRGTAATQRIFSTNNTSGIGSASGGSVGSGAIDTDSDVVINAVGTLTDISETITLESMVIELLRQYDGL